MFFDLLSNPLVILLAATIVVMSLMFLFVGRKKKSKKKVEKVIENKKEEIKQDNNDGEKIDKKETQASEEDLLKKVQINSDLIEIVDENNENNEENNKKSSKSKEKKITKVFVRREKNNYQVNENNNIEDTKYQELSERAEFVSTNKHVSKLNRFLSQEEIEVANTENEEQANNEVRVATENKPQTRIDHSRRLSISIKNDDFDTLFANHISERYMNIDAERHMANKSYEGLFERTDELLKNGETRALDAESQKIFNDLKSEKDKLRFWADINRHKSMQNLDIEGTTNKIIENRGEFSLSLNDIIYAEALLKRKKIKKQIDNK